MEDGGGMANGQPVTADDEKAVDEQKDEEADDWVDSANPWTMAVDD